MYLNRKDINFLLCTQRNLGNYKEKSTKWIVAVSFPILLMVFIASIYLFLEFQIYQYQSEISLYNEYLEKEEIAAKSYIVKSLEDNTKILIDFKKDYDNCKEVTTIGSRLNSDFFDSLSGVLGNKVTATNFEYSEGCLRFTGSTLDYTLAVSVVSYLEEIEEIEMVSYDGFQLKEYGYEFQIECFIKSN